MLYPTMMSSQSVFNTTASPIFIVGLGRSGTTLLRLMLNAHPNIAIPYETNFLDKYGEKIRDYGDLQVSSSLNRLLTDLLSEPQLKFWDCSITKEEVLNELKLSTAINMAAVLSALYMVYARKHSKSRWGDKSAYIDTIPILNSLFPTAKFIHIIRDGRDVIRSTMRLSWGPNDYIAGAMWWNDNVWVCRRMGAVLGPERYIEVRFEDLVNNPQTEMRRLLSFVGETFSDQVLSFHVNAKSYVPQEVDFHYNVDKEFIKARCFAWKEEMSETENALFQRYARQMLGELGYEVRKTSVSKMRLFSCIASQLFRRFIGRSRTKFSRHKGTNQSLTPMKLLPLDGVLFKEE